MKIFAIVFAICIVGALGALTEEQRARLRTYRDSCITETGADRADIDKAWNGDFTDNEKMRCFSSCMLKKMAVIDAEGKLNEATTRTRLANTLTPEKVDEVMTKCKDMRGADVCETGFKLMKCYTETKGPGVLA